MNNIHIIPNIETNPEPKLNMYVIDIKKNNNVNHSNVLDILLWTWRMAEMSSPTTLRRDSSNSVLGTGIGIL